MDPIQPKFFHSSFDLIFQGQSINLHGLISSTGITKIFISSGLPKFMMDSLGAEVRVRIESEVLSGVFEQQFVEHGTFYEVKFRSLGPSQIAYLEKRITNEGISPGWQRKFPRIPVKGYEDPDLPVPNFCMVRFVGQEVIVNVMNFTLGGIRIETIGDSLSSIRVGSVIQFDLITSMGDILTNISGVVRNIATHETKTDQGMVITRSFGIRFNALDSITEQKYRDLIREYCLILQKRFIDKK